MKKFYQLLRQFTSKKGKPMSYRVAFPIYSLVFYRFVKKPPMPSKPSAVIPIPVI